MIQRDEEAALRSLRPSSDAHVTGCRWFWAWALFGGAAAFGVLVVGILAVVPIVLVCGVLAARPAIRHSAFGFATGVGLLFLYVAWVQRAGPGTTCWQSGTASGCDEHLNPLPWLVIGVALFVGGVVGHARQSWSV
jgi:hypothetical protein